MKFPLFPTSLGILITFLRISLMNYLVMKIGATLAMRTISSLLPLPVPRIPSSLLSLFGVLKTPLTLPPTTPSLFVTHLTRHSRAVAPPSL